MLEYVQGRDTSGTTEYIYYDNGGTYTLLGSTSNTNAATTAQTPNVQLASYSSLVFLPQGDSPANIVVFNQAGTIQTLGADPTVNGDYTVQEITPAGATGDTGATGATGT